MLLQIMKCPLHRGAGQLHVRSNGVDTRPALSLDIGAIPQVHINRLSPGGQFGVCINGSEVTHCSSSPKVFVRLDFLLTAVWFQVASCSTNLLDWGRLCSRSTRLAYVILFVILDYAKWEKVARDEKKIHGKKDGKPLQE